MPPKWAISAVVDDEGEWTIDTSGYNDDRRGDATGLEMRMRSPWRLQCNVNVKKWLMVSSPAMEVRSAWVPKSVN